MADDTSAALKALIQQVSALTETVGAQQKKLEGLHDFNARVLDEKKDLQRRLEQQTETDKQLADMGYERASDGNYYPKGTKPAHTLTRAEARDPAKYHAAKEAAAKIGATLEIVDPDKTDDTHRRGRGNVATTTTTIIKDDDQKVAYMRRDVMGADPRQYQRLRAEGMTVKSWDQPDDLPQHMQTKLALMEKSHDA
ncbi:hypothetical protein Ga0609869_001835 [Rhodovulum iodosum]|uniref:Uncharacterized protein n=1 Tax=Rhodovulum iodosum TaxID=68291 RepID=A0ABV3XT38_9RHOB|nr:hypothetical protein [Rhodovulum robiginosum]RSK39016.1 hypothetical protein EJA01_01385 [Rhodovulum robiginosum]